MFCLFCSCLCLLALFWVDFFFKFSFLGVLQWCGDDMGDWEVSEIKVHKKKFPKNQ